MDINSYFLIGTLVGKKGDQKNFLKVHLRKPKFPLGLT